jgi:hypothetical protein
MPDDVLEELNLDSRASGVDGKPCTRNFSA